MRRHARAGNHPPILLKRHKKDAGARIAAEEGCVGFGERSLGSAITGYGAGCRALIFCTDSPVG